MHIYIMIAHNVTKNYVNPKEFQWRSADGRDRAGTRMSAKNVLT